MFTGLVECSGEVSLMKKTPTGARLVVKADLGRDVKIGDSIAVNGVCLTVVNFGSGIAFDISLETMKSTNLGNLKVGDRVNLERALTLTDRLGGHIVTGHVDAVGTIIERRQTGEYTYYRIEVPEGVMRYLVKKGSVAVDGISLTVVSLDETSFTVAIIPHTIKVTNIGDKTAGGTVNIEADILGKYVERFLSREKKDLGLMETLMKEGYIK
ncbi:MAG TPA: riboflavin synthase [Nitrospiraceae bacterium]|nr:riboflavin synthase [Nitrospiraceae bacterium]